MAKLLGELHEIVEENISRERDFQGLDGTSYYP
jgi:hypothetical protein